MLALISLETLRSPSGEGMAVYELDLSLDPSSPSVNQPIGDLREASIGQLYVSPLPENARVAGGEVYLVLNNTVSITLPISEQTAAGRVVTLDDLEALREKLGTQ